MMEAARTSETSVENYFTRQYIPEDNSELHVQRGLSPRDNNGSCSLPPEIGSFTHWGVIIPG
jgi:hypothetical protein